MGALLSLSYCQKLLLYFATFMLQILKVVLHSLNVPQIKCVLKCDTEHESRCVIMFPNLYLLKQQYEAKGQKHVLNIDGD